MQYSKKISALVGLLLIVGMALPLVGDIDYTYHCDAEASAKDYTLKMWQDAYEEASYWNALSTKLIYELLPLGAQLREAQNAIPYDQKKFQEIQNKIEKQHTLIDEASTRYANAVKELNKTRSEYDAAKKAYDDCCAKPGNKCS